MNKEQSNNLSDLNAVLFNQIRNIENKELSDEELERELKKSESITKVAEPNRWRLKQRVVYEEYYGNKQNFRISNLVKMTRAELLRYNQDHLYGKEVKINETTVLVAKLKAKMGEARDGANRRDNAGN